MFKIATPLKVYRNIASQEDPKARTTENEGKMITRIVIPVILVCIVLIVSLATASTFEDITIPPPSDTKPPEKIESVLYQLMTAQNRADFAEAHGLYLKDGKVRVIIELNDTEASEIENVLKGYGAVIETYYKNLVQALVPADKLIALSEEQGVMYIRTPRTPIAVHPQNTSEPTSGPQRPLISPWPLIGIIVAIIATIIVVSLTKRWRS